MLAAGHGRRIKSRTAKVLQPLCGRPVLWHVLDAIRPLRAGKVVLVIRHRGNDVEEAVTSWNLRLPIEFVEQPDPHGTGHAVMVAEGAVASADEVLIANGDEPLVTAPQFRDLVALRRRRKASAAVQTTIPEDARGFARVIRDGDELVRLQEGAEASREELEIAEVATGVYAFRREDLFGALPLVSQDNRQREYYLPDVLGILRDKGERLVVHTVDIGGAVGVNSRLELARAAAVMRRRINADLMSHGVTIVDPETTFVDVGIRVGNDSTILPQTFLEGVTRIGEACVIGPGARIADSTVADEATIEQSVVREARIGRRATVGPFSHLRPGSILGADTKVGSFVEVKGSRIGDGSKVPHLSYVGDTTIGKNVNIGAGTITVNYDGYEKHRTTIGDDVRIGSDTMLVAPVRIGRGAVTGAGSVITKNVPAGALAVERAEQRTVAGYRERKDRQQGRGAGGKA
ncbi:MAG: bifunctional UDP-N-acetylglucosamine diphosphorylase/glucosamine-1-phosphate N-acetyltransferase GlmU [Actinomycetota bacterium]